MECFPRVHNTCFVSNKIWLYNNPNRQLELPKFMHFFGEKLIVSIEHKSNCNKGWH